MPRSRGPKRQPCLTIFATRVCWGEARLLGTSQSARASSQRCAAGSRRSQEPAQDIVTVATAQLRASSVCLLSYTQPGQARGAGKRTSSSAYSTTPNNASRTSLALLQRVSLLLLDVGKALVRVCSATTWAARTQHPRLTSARQASHPPLDLLLVLVGLLIHIEKVPAEEGDSGQPKSSQEVRPISERHAVLHVSQGLLRLHCGDYTRAAGKQRPRVRVAADNGLTHLFPFHFSLFLLRTAAQ